MLTWLYAMLVFAPISVVVALVGGPPLLVFALACLGLILLAGLIGHATGQVALHLGAQYGGYRSTLARGFAPRQAHEDDAIPCGVGELDVTAQELGQSVYGTTLLGEQVC